MINFKKNLEEAYLKDDASKTLKVSKSKVTLKRPSSKLEPIRSLKIKKQPTEEIKRETVYGLDMDFLKKLNLGEDAG
mgnify:CR=1 FL=1